MLSASPFASSSMPMSVGGEEAAAADAPVSSAFLPSFPNSLSPL